MRIPITLFFLSLFGSLLAQQNQVKAIQKNVVLINKEAVSPISGTPSSNSTYKDTSAIQSRIAAIDSHIKAIDIKVAYVNSDQEQRERAEKMGWFEQMYRTREELIQEKNNLVKQLNQK